MPEWGQLPIPSKLLKQGVTDMVRISDARMSGTAYGTCVLHVSPESRQVDRWALVRDGDISVLDAHAGKLDVMLTDSELDARRTSITRRQVSTGAVTPPCTSTGSCRPIRAATSTSWWGARRTPRRSRTRSSKVGLAAGESG